MNEIPALQGAIYMRADASLISVNLVGLVSSVLLLSGCAEIQAQSRVDPQTVASYIKIKSVSTSSNENSSDVCGAGKVRYDSHWGAIDLDCFKFPRSASGKTAYEDARDDQSGDYRNKLAFVLIKQSDDICTIEEGRLVADEASVNTALSTLDSIFSATSTVVTGDRAKSILSGLATVANAGRGHINAEIYRNSLTPSITKAIDGARESKRATIIANFSKDLHSYPLEQMIEEVNEYHHICSFYKGLSLVELAVDRTTITPADRLDSVGSSISLLDARLDRLKSRLTVSGVSQTELDAINKQISDLTTQETDLLKQLTNLQTVTGKPAPASAVPK